jgi:hypothetical protein
MRRQLVLGDNVAQLCQPRTNFGGQLRLHPNAQEPISLRILMAPMWLPNPIFFLSEPSFKFVPIGNQFSKFYEDLIACAGVQLSLNLLLRRFCRHGIPQSNVRRC